MVLEEIFFGLLISFLRGGRLENLNSLKLKMPQILIIGVILNLLLYFFSLRDFGAITYYTIEYFTILHIGIYILLVVGILFNYKYNFAKLLSIGFILNLIPIILNGKMPVSRLAMEKAGQFEKLDLILRGKSLTHGIFLNPRGYFLADIIPIGYSGKVISIGDIVISIGIVMMIIYGMRRD